MISVTEMQKKRKDTYLPIEGYNSDSRSRSKLMETPREDGRKYYTIDEAVEVIGFGKFQMLVVVAVGMAWIVLGMETMVLAIIGPVLTCQYNLPNASEALLTVFSYGGSFVFAWMVGTFGDIYGRKTCLTLGCCWLLWFGFLCAFTPSWQWMLFMRFLVGGGISAMDIAVLYYIEFLPTKDRGKSVILINIFFALGGTFAVLMAMIFLNAYGWRVWIFLCPLPAAAFLFLTPWIPESPRFDLVRGRADLAEKTLKKAARINGKILPSGVLKPFNVEKRARCPDLIAPGYRLSFVFVTILWFATSFIYFGLYFLTAALIQDGNNCGKNSEIGTVWPCVLECGQFRMDTYLDLLWTSLAEFAGLVLPMFMLDSVGRKKTLFTMFFLIAIFCSMLLFCLGRVSMVVFLFLMRSISVATLQLMYLYTPEIYPTKVRAMSLGAGAFAGKFGATVTPLVAQFMLRYSKQTAIAIYVGVALVGAISALLLPFETKGKNLNEESAKDLDS